MRPDRVPVRGSHRESVRTDFPSDWAFMPMRIVVAIAILTLSFTTGSLRAGAARVLIETPLLALDTVARGTLAEGVVVVRNQGSEILRVGLARASERIVVMGKLPIEIAPGTTGRIPVAVQTDDLDGMFRGEMVLTLNDLAVPEAVVTVVCRVADPIEVIPHEGFALTVLRGQVQEEAIEIVNHERTPLRLGAIEYAGGDGFSTRVEVLEAGRLYRLSLSVQGDGPAAVRAHTISVQTSSAALPVLLIPARTTIRERVRVSPESLSLGKVRLSDLATVSQALSQTLVVTRSGSDDFRLTVQTNLPMLGVEATRAPGGDRWSLSLTPRREQLRAGPINGFIFIQTSDPDYPSLSVPVIGELVTN